MLAIDTSSNTVVATVPIGQAPQAVIYVPNAAPAGTAGGLQAGEGMPTSTEAMASRTPTEGLTPPGLAGQATHFFLSAPGQSSGAGLRPPTSVTLFDQGLLQVLEASATGLEPGRPYVLALSHRPDGGGELEPLSSFITNAAGAAIVNAVGPIRQLVRDATPAERRYLVIAPGSPGEAGKAVQVMNATSQ
jgi:hypothetical protein